MNFRQKFNFAWRILRARRGGNMEAWAEKELALAFPPDDPDEPYPMNRWLAESTLDIIRVFTLAGHSGGSAPLAIEVAQRLMSWKPLAPLTGEPAEWMEIEPGTFQNVRAPNVFKDATRSPYILDGYIFEEPDGCRFTGRGSHMPIEFPFDVGAFKPTIVNVDADGVPILTKYRKLRE